MKNINRLEEREKDHLSVLPIYITVLIASADGEIDQAEIRKAVDLSNSGLQDLGPELKEYYSSVFQDYEDKLKITIANLPTKKEERHKYLLRQLIKANDIFQKLDKPWAIKLYESFKDLAKKIAEASGGILGYGKIGFEESKLIDLHMIQNPDL